MFSQTKCVALVALFSLIGVGTVVAHPDDPKMRDRMPRYEGPGFRRAEWMAQGGGDLRGAAGGFDSEGIVLRSWLPLAAFGPDANGNDCWGYVSPTGREYALIGLERGTGIVEVSDPDNAQIVEVMPGPTSLWRDIKVYQHYAYAVSEGGSGIQVFDLDDIDSGVVTQANTVTTGGTTATHNVVIDEDSGYLYRCGGSSNGLRIYDLSNPASPTYVNSWPDLYVHDAEIVSIPSGPGNGPYAGRQLAFCCAGLNGGWLDPSLVILDVTDKLDIQVISTTIYPNSGYSHQGWLSADRHYFYLGDELDEDQGSTPTTLTRVFDVSNPANPHLVSTFTNGSTAIDHNIAVVGDLIFEANYRSGLRIYDATNPTSPVEIAYFDTFPGSNSANFNGLWNSYPYFPSGTIIGSDLERGLFVWSFSGPPFEAPTAAPFPHDRTKNRYISFTPRNEAVRVAFQVELTDLQLGSCDGNGARCRIDHGNDDCGACSVSGNPCRNDSGCSAGEACQLTGDVCVNDLFGSVGQTWWLGPPDANGVCRLVSESFRHFQKFWPNVVHVGDCEIVPNAVYSIRAYDETEFSDPLAVTTVTQNGAEYWADVVGPYDTFCDGNPLGALCGHAGDPSCSGGHACLGAYSYPDGSTNFDDVGAAIRMFQAPAGLVLPDMTWVDIHGNSNGDAWLDPPNFVANMSDVQFMVLAFQGAPYPFVDPLMCPDIAP